MASRNTTRKKKGLTRPCFCQPRRDDADAETRIEAMTSGDVQRWLRECGLEELGAKLAAMGTTLSGKALVMLRRQACNNREAFERSCSRVGLDDFKPRCF